MDVFANSRGTMERLTDRARSMSGWLRFFGVVNVAAAIPSILSIFGILFAWLPIWLGVLLIQAGSAARHGSDEELVRMIEKLRLYFIIQCLLVVVVLIAFAITFTFFGSVVFEMMRDMGAQGPTWEV